MQPDEIPAHLLRDMLDLAPGEVLAETATVRIPGEVAVRTQRGAKVGTARLTVDGDGVTAEITFDAGSAGPAALDAMRAGLVDGLAFRLVSRPARPATRFDQHMTAGHWVIPLDGTEDGWSCSCGTTFASDSGWAVCPAAPSTAPMPAVMVAPGVELLDGTRHRHPPGDGGQGPVAVEHDHLAGGRPHRHDAGTGAQIPLGCDPDRCRYPFGSHADTCRL
jgi:hypothetical protein